MRKAFAGAAAAAFLVFAASAFASTDSRSLSISPSQTTIRYGGNVVLNGHIGAVLGTTSVTLVAHSTGKTAQGLLAADAAPGGTFRFDVAPTTRTVYTARAGSAARSIVINVAPRVGLLRNGTARVAPIGMFVGKTVLFQTLENGTWRTVMSSTFDRNGTAQLAHWTPGQTVRAYVPAIGHGFVGGPSRILTADGKVILR